MRARARAPHTSTTPSVASPSTPPAPLPATSSAAEPSRAERRAEQHSTSRQRVSARERRFLPPVPVVITTQAGVADAPGDTPGAELSEGGGVRQGENMFRHAGPLARDGAARTRARDIAPDAGVPRGPRGSFTGAARPMRGRRSPRPPTRGRAAARAQSHTRARAPHPHFTRPLAVAQRPRGPRRPTLAALYPPRARAGRTGETRLITSRHLEGSSSCVTPRSGSSLGSLMTSFGKVDEWRFTCAWDHHWGGVFSDAYPGRGSIPDTSR